MGLDEWRDGSVERGRTEGGQGGLMGGWIDICMDG